MKKDYLSKQIDFFNDLKSNSGVQASLPAVIAEILNISIDSAYRRMRGETPLILPEITRICDHFNTSFSYGNKNGEVNELRFFYKSLCNDKQPLKDLIFCLSELYENLTRILQNEHAILYLTLTDIHIMYLHKFRELTNFRIKVWFKEMTGRDITQNEGYDENFERLLVILEKIYELIKANRHVEIWSNQSIDDLLSSITYHHQMGELASETADRLFVELNAFLTDSYDRANIQSHCEMYFSEMELSNGYMIAEGGAEKLSVIKMFSINSIITFDEVLYDDIKLWIDLIINNSVLINRSNRKQRHMYFSNLMNEVSKSQNILGLSANTP